MSWKIFQFISHHHVVLIEIQKLEWYKEWLVIYSEKWVIFGLFLSLDFDKKLFMKGAKKPQKMFMNGHKL